MKFESKFGIGEIVIRETHQNGKMVQERMMEVIGVNFGKSSSGSIACSYLCEDTQNGHRQFYDEPMLVGDPDFDQNKGKYPYGIIDGDTNRESESI